MFKRIFQTLWRMLRFLRRRQVYKIHDVFSVGTLADGTGLDWQLDKVCRLVSNWEEASSSSKWMDFWFVRVNIGRIGHVDVNLKAFSNPELVAEYLESKLQSWMESDS